jgi:hypothetical protein
MVSSTPTLRNRTDTRRNEKQMDRERKKEENLTYQLECTKTSTGMEAVLVGAMGSSSKRSVGSILTK